MVTVKLSEYTHQKAGEEYRGLAGYYVPYREVRLPFEGREILYVVGKAVIEGSCCGEGNWDYALVPGYIVNWQSRINAAGLAISEIEPIHDSSARSRLSDIIRDREGIRWVTFWS